MIATIVPIAAQGGSSAVLGIGVTVLAMSLMRLELIAVFAGLATIAAARAFGF